MQLQKSIEICGRAWTIIPVKKHTEKKINFSNHTLRLDISASDGEIVKEFFEFALLIINSNSGFTIGLKECIIEAVPITMRATNSVCRVENNQVNFEEIPKNLSKI